MLKTAYYRNYKVDDLDLALQLYRASDHVTDIYSDIKDFCYDRNITDVEAFISVLMDYNKHLRNGELSVAKVDRLEELASSIVATYRRKNQDYGDSFGKSVQRYGLISALTRMSDKWNRAENLILSNDNNGVVADESLRDTLLDLATYCMMTIIEMEDLHDEHN